MKPKEMGVLVWRLDKQPTTVTPDGPFPPFQRPNPSPRP